MHFAKYHGLGNDFVFVDASQETLADVSRAARILCDRRCGVGADGLVLLRPQADGVHMRIINSDGTEAEMCGNASRCVPLFAREKGWMSGDGLTLQTLAGPIKTRVQDRARGLVSVNMGRPRLLRGQIPVAGPAEEQAVNMTLFAAGQNWTGTAVSMGNPHFVIFVPDLAQVDLPHTGPLLEVHPAFPKKTNVEFVQVLDRNTLRMRVWERGAGITQACGTGACATAVAAQLTGRSDAEVQVILDGGALQIAWQPGQEVYMTGPAAKVFEGEFTADL